MLKQLSNKYLLTVIVICNLRASQGISSWVNCEGSYGVLLSFISKL